MNFHFLFFLLSYLIIASFPTNAQTNTQEEALNLFEKENYTKASPIFEQLVTLYPKDPRFQYYAGACLVQTNTSLNQAVNYLTYASTGTVPRDVYYFLGKAYHLQYKFDEALESYLKFRQFGDKAMKDRWQCDMNIEMVREGKKLLEKQYVFEVYKTDTISIEELYDFYNGLLKNGKFVERPGTNVAGNENKSINSRVFIPELLDKNQLIFESTQVGIFHKNRDLFSVRKLSENEWSHPENLGHGINSPYDEAYAYFNVSESALYFSSKGHHSMGGYDIYKSVYDPDKRTWSTPANLGFPVNSPYDDFLFVPSEDQSQAYFCSNRGTHDKNKVVVYTISFSRNYKTISSLANTDYTQVSMLHPIIAKNVITNSKTKVNSIVASHLLPNQYPAELLNQNDYNEMINLAMKFQLQSDSMGRAAESLRQRIPSVKSEIERQQLKKDLYSLEKKSKETQKKADGYYDKARTLEKKYTGKRQPTDTISNSKNDLVKNTFNNSRKPKNKSYKVINDFKITTKTPYATLEEIPLNPPLIEGLIYRIQLGVFSKSVNPGSFKGMAPLIGETLPNGSTKYYAGLFSRLTDAENALNKVHEIGLKDAYIISFYNGTKISSNRAKELEKDQK